MECDICGKRPRFGYNVSHSKRHTKRRWMPNVHKATLVVGGVEKRMNLCTRCLRTQAKTAR